MTRRDWLLLALADAQVRGLTPVQLQKTLFVLGKEVPEELGPFYFFSTYHYGPFSAAIYDDAESLAAAGLIYVSGEGRLRRYRITVKGMEAAARMATEAPQRAVGYLRSVVQWAQSLSFSELVKAIYAHYPGTDANSIFRHY